MEHGTKEDPSPQKEPRFLGKAGWVKKAYGRLLASYKDRFLRVEKTEIAVYENEDLQNCMERLDLENYDKCHELKSPFKKKHRLVLIRSSKPGNKVHDVKFQAQTAEEKDAWIKALGDGINRAKNKVFDEVKVDEASNLEHVTRTRPKGNRNRRPPTRIHMKEVAGVSSDGILRLDLDLEDAVMPNGTHTDGGGTSPSPPATAGQEKEKGLESSAGEKDEPDAGPQKAIKPPMPPTKEAKAAAAAETEPAKQDGLQKKVLKPPMPPSKEAKACARPTDDDTEDQNLDKKKTGLPPTPPNKPNSSGSPPSPHPPAPPSKDKKPSPLPVEPGQGLAEDSGEEEEEEDTTDAGVEPEETDESTSEEGDDEPPSLSVTGSVSDDEEALDDGTPTQPRRLSLTPPPEEKPWPNEGGRPASDASGRFPPALEPARPGELPSLVVSLNDPLADGLSLSPLLRHSSGQKAKKAEEKSVDSGQHSDDESEGSVGEDAPAASAASPTSAASAGALDELDARKDHISVSLRPTARPPVGPKLFSSRRSEPSQKSLTPSTKAKSASSGDLLSDSSGRVTPIRPRGAADTCAPLPQDNVEKLESQVALEMENTDELLRQARGESSQEGVPEDLLAKAMEKLRKADHFLREVKKLKLSNNSGNRMSW
ncbi:pleckstrin homology domain-containing family O member 2 [Cololabis saira]|uniref:pleckstrin homology domain-containing family O member 2 n=1 Tax=Cololabis saira TaxID=129043 RepID=UPI002AD35F36|nr:pleckstrin homology domain-containing family O member 2 [Cololabis saira]